MHLGSGHNIRAKVNQQVIIDERSGAFSQTCPAKLSGLFAVIAFAEGFGEGVRRRSSKEGDEHLRNVSVLAHWSREPRGFAVYWEELDNGIEVNHLLSPQPV